MKCLSMDRVGRTTERLLATCLMAALAGCAPSRTDAALNVVKVLSAQADAWNRGDIDGFMAHYWISDELTFCASGTTLDGWAATLARYKEKYPTPERMGRVEFDNLRITPLGEDAALVIGRWRVQREGDPIGGVFSLVLRRTDGRWVIIHDHTSATESHE
jgi:beta-aspartyl-peptidase (threonine type)